MWQAVAKVVITSLVLLTFLSSLIRNMEFFSVADTLCADLEGKIVKTLKIRFKPGPVEPDLLRPPRKTLDLNKGAGY